MTRARRALLVAAALAGGWMVCVGVLSPWIVPLIWTTRHVAPHLRADRWELGSEGMRARAMTEEICGSLPADAWLDFPTGAIVPALRGAAVDQRTCFAEEVAPRFTRDLVLEPPVEAPIE